MLYTLVSFEIFVYHNHRLCATPLEAALTVPLGAISTLVARASQPIIRAISCTRDFVSFEEVDSERSWESFAWRHGCLETRTLEGREDMIAVVLVLLIT